jgi:hypothetical protein
MKPKVCSKCEAPGPFTKRGSICRPCHAAWQASYYQRNKETINRQKREWVEVNREHVRTQNRARYEVNREQRKAESRERYVAKREQLKRQVHERRARIHAQTKPHVDAAKSRPCQDCGDTFPLVAMDFDHLRDKVASVSAMVSACRPLDAILEEIGKCEVVCACCHRTRTLSRRGAFPYPPGRLVALIRQLKAGSCTVCGISRAPECMDFDHRDPAIKSTGIARLQNYVDTPKNRERLLDEVAKCDLLCANCHRIKTVEKGETRSRRASP